MDEILNASFDFTRANPDHVAAFRGTPRRVLFQPGDRLSRFTSLPAGGFPGNALFDSPWWLPRATFDTLTRLAHRTSAPLVDTVRARMAVTRQWNPTLEWLAVIELTQSVYGWGGAHTAAAGNPRPPVGAPDGQPRTGLGPWSG